MSKLVLDGLQVINLTVGVPAVKLVLDALPTTQLVLGSTGSKLVQTTTTLLLQGGNIGAKLVSTPTLLQLKVAVGGGEVNTGANVGGGAEVFRDKAGAVLNFRTLVGVGDIAVAEVGDTIEISETARRRPPAFVLEDPTGSERFDWFYNYVATTVSEVRAVLNGSGGQSIDFSVRFDVSRAAVGTEILTGGRTVTNTTTGTPYTPDVTIIPAGQWVWIQTTAQAGTVLELAIVMDLTP